MDHDRLSGILPATASVTGGCDGLGRAGADVVGFLGGIDEGRITARGLFLGRNGRECSFHCLEVVARSTVECRILEDDCADIGKEGHHVGFLDGRLAWVCTAIPILETGP